MYQQLTNEEKLVVNSEVQKQGKSFGVAFALAFFLGTIGVHRFYLGKMGSGIFQLILTVLGYLTAVFLIGFLFLGIVGVWVVIDWFLVGKLVNEYNKDLEEQLAKNTIQNRVHQQKVVNNVQQHKVENV